MPLFQRLTTLALVIALAGCASAPKAVKLPREHSIASAVANIAPVSGTLTSGRLRIMPVADGVHIGGELGGLARMSKHAIHVHEYGDCSAADGSSAGAHFNPTASMHGRASTKNHHAGDMDNLQSNAAGVARVDLHLRGVTLGGGAINDILGRAIVVHAGPDDYTSQPAGNSGPRVGCGTITVGY